MTWNNWTEKNRKVHLDSGVSSGDKKITLCQLYDTGKLLITTDKSNVTCLQCQARRVFKEGVRWNGQQQEYG